MVDKDEELRPPAAVAQRALALLMVIQRVYEESPLALRNWVTERGIDQYFSEAEREYFFSDSPTERQRSNFSWRSEAALVLLWALGLGDRLPSLRTKANLSGVSALAEVYSDIDAFVASATLRSELEFHELEEKMSEVHWKVRDAKLNGKRPPRHVDGGIIQERRHTTCWLLGDEDWDEVAVDT